MANEKGSFLICVHCGKGVGEGIGEDCYGAEDTMHDFQDSRPAEPQAGTQVPSQDWKAAYKAWWDGLTREGDPLHIPNKFARAFEAGWNARDAGSSQD
jgi:hypothetical protein